MAKPIRYCSESECSSRCYGHGLCCKHYQKWRRTRPAEKGEELCCIPDCRDRALVRHMCDAHWQRWRKGRPMDRARNGAPIMARFFKVIHVDENKCWNWGNSQANGYRAIEIKGKTIQAHVFSYEHFVGPVPEGLQLDHLCRNKRCVNPDHLEPVTASVNVRRGTSPAAANAIKTHCKRGHEFTPENTCHRKGKPGRTCRTCKNEWMNESNHKKQELRRFFATGRPPTEAQ